MPFIYLSFLLFYNLMGICEAMSVDAAVCIREGVTGVTPFFCKRPVIVTQVNALMWTQHCNAGRGLSPHNRIVVVGLRRADIGEF